MKTSPVRMGFAFLVLSLFVAACSDDDPQGPVDTEPEPPNVAADGEELWSFLEDEQYQDEWGLWPDRGERYEGQEPHGMEITTYINDVAQHSLEHDESEMPPGAIVVKENYAPDGGDLQVITTMYSARGAVRAGPRTEHPRHLGGGVGHGMRPVDGRSMWAPPPPITRRRTCPAATTTCVFPTRPPA